MHEYKAVIEIDLNEDYRGQILGFVPNDPDDVKTLSEILEQGMKTRFRMKGVRRSLFANIGPN